mmetsp:Transcript_35500/g.102070  ORF Transcript_35500/g.102070 Transcript_35500/m.102070 type:complete len:397 (-) Transcript_35500:115-1305(-)
MADEDVARVPHLQQTLNRVCLRGHAEGEPERDVRPAQHDAHPIYPIPEAPVVLAARAQAAHPHAAEDVLQLPVGGVDQEHEVDDVHHEDPLLGVGLDDHRAGHGVRHHEAPAVEVRAHLGDGKHAHALVPGGEHEVQAVRVPVGPARGPEHPGGRRGGAPEVPGAGPQVLPRRRGVQQPLRAHGAAPAALAQAHVPHEHVARGEGAEGLARGAVVAAVAQERGQARGHEPLPHLRGVAHVLPVVGARVVGAVAVDPLLDAPLQLLPLPDLQVQDHEAAEDDEHHQGQGQRAEGVVAVRPPVEALHQLLPRHRGLVAHAPAQRLLGSCLPLQLEDVVPEGPLPQRALELPDVHQPVAVLVGELEEDLHLGVSAGRRQDRLEQPGNLGKLQGAIVVIV